MVSRHGEETCANGCTIYPVKEAVYSRRDACDAFLNHHKMHAKRPIMRDCCDVFGFGDAPCPDKTCICVSEGVKACVLVCTCDTRVSVIRLRLTNTEDAEVRRVSSENANGKDQRMVHGSVLGTDDIAGVVAAAVAASSVFAGVESNSAGIRGIDF